MGILTGEAEFSHPDLCFLLLLFSLLPSLSPWWGEFSISVLGFVLLVGWFCFWFLFLLPPALQHSLTGTLIILTKVSI